MLRRFFQIFCLLAIFSGQGQAASVPQDIHAAMIAAWNRTSHGQSRSGSGFEGGMEAGFSLEGTPSSYTIKVAAVDNGTDRLVTEIDSRTFALYHVHPNHTIPQPSPNDIAIANKYHLLMYTMSERGVFLYDLSTGRITEVEGDDWFKS